MQVDLFVLSCRYYIFWIPEVNVTANRAKVTVGARRVSCFNSNFFARWNNFNRECGSPFLSTNRTNQMPKRSTARPRCKYTGKGRLIPHHLEKGLQVAVISLTRRAEVWPPRWLLPTVFNKCSNQVQKYAKTHGKYVLRLSGSVLIVAVVVFVCLFRRNIHWERCILLVLVIQMQKFFAEPEVRCCYCCLYSSSSWESFVLGIY